MSLTRIAVGRIRDAIVSGRLAFGEPLSEANLATAFGMSKAPVRAALIELREKGLVTIAPQAGTFVCSPTAEDIAKLSSFRYLIESEAMRCAFDERPEALLAALDEAVARMIRARERDSGPDYIAADTLYHLAFIDLSGNRFLQRAYDLASGIVEALRVRLFNAAQSFQQKSFTDHVDILKLLRHAELEKASAILEDHIMRTTQLLEFAPPAQARKGRRTTKACEHYRELFRTGSDRGP